MGHRNKPVTRVSREAVSAQPGDTHLIGHTVGNYEVKALLGEGGMGTVYLAEHTVMGWRAAVKVLRRSLADDRVLVKRFINEARVIKAVRHPNIVEIVDVGILPDGLPYLLMELLEGETLGARLHRLGRLTVEQALDVTTQTATALQAAHDKGIIHRDLKPDNLFLVRDPENPAHEKVKVLDFGIAKLADAEPRGASAHTRSGVLLGTPAYMSPEQCRGIAESVDHRADIYALAVILYQMLAGRAPFVGAGTGDVLIMHVSTEPTPIGQDNPAVPHFVEAAITRGLAKLREHRFQSMAEFAAALQGNAQETLQIPFELPAEPLRPTSPVPVQSANPTVTTPFSWTSETRSARRLSRRALAIGAAVVVAVPLLLLVAADGIRWTARDRSAQPPAHAAAPGGLTRTATPEPAAPRELPAAVIPRASALEHPPTLAPKPPAAAANEPPSRTRPAAGPPTRKRTQRPRPPAPAPATVTPPAEARPQRRAKPWL
jgi:serine/threonine-protein kinase